MPYLLVVSHASCAWISRAGRPCHLTAEFWFGAARLSIGSVSLNVKAKLAVEVVFGGDNQTSRFCEFEGNAAFVVLFFRVIRNKDRRVALDFSLAGGRAEI